MNLNGLLVVHFQSGMPSAIKLAEDNLIFVLGSAESSETIPELCGDGIHPECHRHSEKRRLSSNITMPQLETSTAPVF